LSGPLSFLDSHHGLARGALACYLARPLRPPYRTVFVMQHPRYVVLIFAVGGLISALSVKSASVSLFEQYGVADVRFLGLAELSSLVAFVVGVLAFVTLLRVKAAVSYVDEVVDEVTKVTWPSRDETFKAATTVVGTTAFVAVLIGVYDFLWKALADRFLYSS
jgi:preprotein translocase SecE subunit